MKNALAVAALGLVLLSCSGNRQQPYRTERGAPGENPQGTPADRTGGARNAPDGAGPAKR